MPSLGDIRFIDDNPASTAYAQRAQALTSQRAAEAQAERQQFEMDEARRTAAQAEATDKALADVVLARTSPTAPAPANPGTAQATPLPEQPGMELKPGGGVQPIGVQAGATPVPAAPQAQAAQPSLYSDAATKLAKAGRGGHAMRLLEAQQKQQDQWEELAIKALGTGDMETFAFYQKKSGLQLPPEVMQSAEARGNFARALDIAKQNYKDDPAQGQVFAATFMATPGDFQAKLQAAASKAGPPRTKPHWTATTVMQNGQQVLAFYDANTGAVRVTDYQKPENGYGTQYMTDPNSGEAYMLQPGSSQLRPITKPDGTVFTGTKMGTPGKGAGKPVKIGALTGNLYADDHQGPGANGEDVVSMPAAEATRLAVARGNNRSREQIATITGDYSLMKQDSANQGRLQVAEVNGQWGQARTEQQGANSLATQKLRNEGNLAAAQARGAAGGGAKDSVFKQKQAAWLASHPGDEHGALDYAGGRRKASPAEEQKMAASIAKAEFSGAFNVPPEKVQARVQEIMQSWRTPGAAPPPPPAPAAATPPVAQPTPNGQNGAAPPPAPASLKGRKLQWSPSRKAFRDAATDRKSVV